MEDVCWRGGSGESADSEGEGNACRARRFPTFPLAGRGQGEDGIARRRTLQPAPARRPPASAHALSGWPRPVAFLPS